MNKVRDFFASLNKSTKITLISCICFMVLTAVILLFFILFPISPNDTIQEKYGREIKASKSSDSTQTITTQPVDGDSYVGSKGTAVSQKVTTARVSRKKSFSVNVTTGDGFFSGGRIPTGGDPYVVSPGEETTTTAGYVDPEPPTTDYPYEPPVVTTSEPIDIPPVTTDPIDPPPATDPPPVTDPPPATDPPPVTDPPPATDSPDTNGGDTQSW